MIRRPIVAAVAFFTLWPTLPSHAESAASGNSEAGTFDVGVEATQKPEEADAAQQQPQYVIQDYCIELPITHIGLPADADLSGLGTCLHLPCGSADGVVQQTVPLVNGVPDMSNASDRWCPSEQAAVDPLPGAVARAFAQVPVPSAVLSIQPPKGKTLVGLETIFSTTVEPFTRTLTLLGRRIELRITPSSFQWLHGDGTTQTSDWAGRAWDGNDNMDRYLTHTYEHTGTMHPSVTVTWTATWRIGNNPWRTVDGTVTKAGARADLAVVEAEPELVAP